MKSFNVEGDNFKITVIPATQYTPECYALTRFGELVGSILHTYDHAVIIKDWMDTVRYDTNDDGDIHFF